MEKNEGRRGAFKSLGHTYITSYKLPQGHFFYLISFVSLQRLVINSPVLVLSCFYKHF